MDDTVEKLRAAYDAMAYKSYAHYQAHPDRLAVVAALAGIPAAAVDNCRVLEVGCATGGNLIPMAEQLPASRFLGIDLSDRQIQTGSGVVRELGLNNIELRCQDLMEFPEGEGQFDYIIAQGVYSWAPRTVQQRLLEVCRRHLAPNGVAYVSYNAYPGWCAHEIAREMMMYHSQRGPGARERITLGRQIVEFMAEHSPAAPHYRDILKFLWRLIGGESDENLLYDQMEWVNEPQYFWKFMEAAAANRLAYVGDASAHPDPWLILTERDREHISKMSDGPLQREQYVDFLIGRSFRGTVLCNAEIMAAPRLGIAGVRSFYIAGNPPDVPAGTDPRKQPSFQFGDGPYKLTTSDPAGIWLLRRLCQAWPSAISFTQLRSEMLARRRSSDEPERITEFLEHLIRFFHGGRLIELWSRPTAWIASAGESCPCASPYARWQAAHGSIVVSLRHTPIELDDRRRRLLQLLNGRRNESQLVSELVQQSQAHAGEVEAFVKSALEFFTKSSLVADSRPEN